MKLTRRMMLVSTVSVAGLSACASGGTTPASIIAYAQGAVSGLQKVLPFLAGVVPADTLASITSTVASAQTLIASFSGSLNAAQGASVLQQVEAYVNAAVDALAGFPGIPNQYALIISAVSVVLPVIEAYINSVLPPSAAAATKRAPIRRALPWNVQAPTLNQAKVILGIS